MKIALWNSAALMLWALDAGELAASSEDRAAGPRRDPARARFDRIAARNDTRAAAVYGRDAMGCTL